MTPASTTKLQMAPDDARHSDQVTTGNGVWLVDSAHYRLIDGRLGDRWFDPSTFDDATCAKRTGSRRVWRVMLEGRTYYAKIYAPPKGLRRVKAFLRGFDAGREYSAGCFALQNGIAAIQPVAFGRQTRGKDAGLTVFVSEALDGQPLGDYWSEQTTQAGDRRHALAMQLGSALADLIGRAHRYGFIHADLHPGNILVTGSGSDIRCHFADLHNVSIYEAPSPRRALGNLVQLNQWFSRRATAAERWRFFKMYRQIAAGTARLDDRAQSRAYATALNKLAHKHAERLGTKRDRRTLRTGKYFERLTLPEGWKGVVVRRIKHFGTTTSPDDAEFATDKWREFLSSLPQRFDAPGRADSVTDSPAGTVLRTEANLGFGVVPVICERPRYRTVGRRLTGFIASQSYRNWRRGYALINRGLPAIRPLALIEKRRLGLTIDSILVCEYPEDDISSAGIRFST